MYSLTLVKDYEYICVADWEWRTIFIKNAVQEVAEKSKNWKDAAIKRKLLKNNVAWNNFLRSMIRNQEQWVCSSTILTYRAVMTIPRSSSSSYYLEFNKA